MVRARTVGQSDRRTNATTVPMLVERLEDADPVVRLAAFEELRRRTGRDFGYVPWASVGERAAAVGRWRTWLAGPPESAERVRTTGLPPPTGTGPHPPVPVDSSRPAIP